MMVVGKVITVVVGLYILDEVVGVLATVAVTSNNTGRFYDVYNLIGMNDTSGLLTIVGVLLGISVLAAAIDIR